MALANTHVRQPALCNCCRIIMHCLLTLIRCVIEMIQLRNIVVSFAYFFISALMRRAYQTADISSCIPIDSKYHLIHLVRLIQFRKIEHINDFQIVLESYQLVQVSCRSPVLQFFQYSARLMTSFGRHRC